MSKDIYFATLAIEVASSIRELLNADHLREEAGDLVRLACYIAAASGLEGDSAQAKKALRKLGIAETTPEDLELIYNTWSMLVRNPAVLVNLWGRTL